MQSVDMDSKEWQLGTTKVFIKSPESLFLLEEQRDRRYHEYAVKIQRAWRRYKSRKYFLEMRKKAANILYNRKERKRLTINREFMGDYLNLLDNPVLKSLISKLLSKIDNKTERTLFSDTVVKYDRAMKGVHREFLITDQSVFIIGAEKKKDGPNKGKFVKIVKRQIAYSKIQGITLSTLADDLFVLHVADDYDSVMENFLKTELITVLGENYSVWAGKPLSIKFQDSISYTVKKTTWQSGGTCELKFIVDDRVKFPTPKNNGKTTEIRVPPGLPRDSKPKQSTLFEKKSVPVVSKSKVEPLRQAPTQPPPSFQQGSASSIPQAKVSAQPSSVATLGASFGSNQNVPKGPGSQNSMIHASGSQPTMLQSSNSSVNILKSNDSMLAVAAAKKKPPPPPAAKKIPRCKALYV